MFLASCSSVSKFMKINTKDKKLVNHYLFKPNKKVSRRITCLENDESKVNDFYHWADKGQCAYLDGKNNHAFTYFSMAKGFAKTKEQKFIVLHNLSVLYYMEGHNNLSVQYAREANKLSSNVYGLYNLLVHAYHQGEYKQAKQIITAIYSKGNTDISEEAMMLEFFINTAEGNVPKAKVVYDNLPGRIKDRDLTAIHLMLMYYKGEEYKKVVQIKKEHSFNFHKDININKIRIHKMTEIKLKEQYNVKLSTL